MDARHVQATSDGVDLAGDSVGAEDMGGEGVDSRRRVSEEVGEGDGGERVGVGVGRCVVENHLVRRKVNRFARIVGKTLRARA